MSALKLPSFMRSDRPRVTLRERAKALATTTAKILHFPRSKVVPEGNSAPSKAQAAADAALLALAAKYTEAMRTLNHARGRNDEQSNADADAVMRLEAEIAKTPATSGRGLRAKAEIVRALLDDAGSDDDLGRLVRSLLNDVVRVDHRRMAAAGTGAAESLGPPSAGLQVLLDDLHALDAKLDSFSEDDLLSDPCCEASKRAARARAAVAMFPAQSFADVAAKGRICNEIWSGEHEAELMKGYEEWVHCPVPSGAEGMAFRLAIDAISLASGAPTTKAAPCPVEAYGYDFGRLVEAHSVEENAAVGPGDGTPSFRRADALQERLDTIHEAVSHMVPQTLGGVLFQTMLAASDMYCVASSSPAEVFANRGRRLLAAAVRGLEQIAGLSREPFGARYYMPDHLDPLVVRKSAAAEPAPSRAKRESIDENIPAPASLGAAIAGLPIYRSVEEKLSDLNREYQQVYGTYCEASSIAGSSLESDKSERVENARCAEGNAYRQMTEIVSIMMRLVPSTTLGMGLKARMIASFWGPDLDPMNTKPGSSEEVLCQVLSDLMSAAGLARIGCYDTDPRDVLEQGANTDAPSRAYCY